VGGEAIEPGQWIRSTAIMTLRMRQSRQITIVSPGRWGVGRAKSKAPARDTRTTFAHVDWGRFAPRIGTDGPRGTMRRSLTRASRHESTFRIAAWGTS